MKPLPFLSEFNAAHSTACNTHTELAIHARTAVEKISAKTDASVLTTSLRSSFTLSIPPRTLYYNYDAGECSDLVFGVSLVDYATVRESQNNIPHILKLCIEEVDKRGLGVERIYTVSSLTKLVLSSLISD